MVALGRTLFVVHLVFLVLAGIFFGASIGGFWGDGYMIVSALLVIALWSVFAGLTIKAVRLANCVANETGSLEQTLKWAKWLFFTVMILSPFTGLGLAFLSFVGCGPLWIPSLYHWTGMIGTILGFLAFFLLPVLVRACVDECNGYGTFYPWWKVVLAPLGVAILWGLAWLIPYLKLKGDINVSEYQAKDHIYKLPFPGGESSWVIQGNNSSFNHNNGNLGQKYSWDFRRRCGTPVLAARDGKIASFDDTHDGIGGPNNQVQVAQADGTVAFYLHIEKGSVPAKFRTIGAAVKQGDEIARVGSVGNSLTGHVHFMVRQNSTSTTATVAVSFTDVSDDNGIPRTFGSYASGNRIVP
jgi:peptidase M23-like protein